MWVNQKRKWLLDSITVQSFRWPLLLLFTIGDPSLCTVQFVGHTYPAATWSLKTVVQCEVTSVVSFPAPPGQENTPLLYFCLKKIADEMIVNEYFDDDDFDDDDYYDDDDDFYDDDDQEDDFGEVIDEMMIGE